MKRFLITCPPLRWVVVKQNYTVLKCFLLVFHNLHSGIVGQTRLIGMSDENNYIVCLPQIMITRHMKECYLNISIWF
jgi:hypothetical protein